MHMCNILQLTVYNWDWSYLSILFQFSLAPIPIHSWKLVQPGKAVHKNSGNVRWSRFIYYSLTIHLPFITQVHYQSIH